MNRSVQFSIVIPVYCVEAYLPQAIESVLAQSVSDWELILVDDGSPDGCGELCDRYAEMDKRVHVIHKPNGGAVSARQAGMEQCHGTYILTLDGDDYWDSDLLSQLQVVISQYNPDGIHFGFRRVKEGDKRLSDEPIRVPEGNYTGDALTQLQKRMLYDTANPELNTGVLFFSQWAFAFRREIVTPFQQLVPKQIKIGEDAAVIIPTACHCGSIYFLNRIMYNYRIRKNSVSRTFSHTEIKESVELMNHFRQYAECVPTQNLNGCLYRMAENYWINAARNLPSYGEFKKCVKESLQVMPEDVMQNISQFHLSFKYKLRFLTVRYRLWFLLWLIYHRN